jgi:hypothetical protein
MTYCVGFKRGPVSCLVADSAVTGPSPDQPHTSFEELHVTDRSPGVSERALKIFRFSEAALTFAGNMAIGRAFIAQFATRAANGMSVPQAFEESAASVTPLRNPADLQVFCAWSTPAGGRLLSFNAARDQRIAEHEDLAQIGSADVSQLQTTADFIEWLRPGPLNPEQFMLAVTSLCQSYGIHDYLLRNGIGGAFCSIAAGPTGVDWQPDTTYLFYHSGMFTFPPSHSTEKGRTVVVCVHKGVLALRSTAAGQVIRLMTNSDRDELPDAAQARLKEAQLYSNEVLLQQRAHYLVFLATDFHSITPCEVRGHLNKGTSLVGR